MNELCIVICSHPNSKRVERKCFIDVAGHPALGHILTRIKPLNVNTILAIPDNLTPHDNELYKNIVASYLPNAYIYRGVNSPLHRMNDSIEWAMSQEWGEQIKYVCRITHDDLLIDAETLKSLYGVIRMTNGGYGITPDIIEGSGVEIISFENINFAANKYKKYIEHISYAVKGENCPNEKVVRVSVRPEIDRKYNLSLDTYDDYLVLNGILRKLGSFANVDDICTFLDIHPNMAKYNEKPLISVYTCAYNSEDTIQETMNSVFRSRLADFEYIIIDDGSTDGTLYEIMNHSHSNKIKLIKNEKNIGLASSCNIALDHAKGKYIIRVDSDDILFFDTLDTLYNKIKFDDSVVCYSGFYDEKNKQERENYNVLPQKNHHAGCAMMEARFIREMKFKEGLRHWDGLEFYNRIKDNFPISYIEEPLWFYRHRDNSLSNKKNKDRQKAWEVIEGEKNGKDL